ncbi:MAG: hypothetical protein KGI51_16130, partial [Rhodospirillales bacterium]|nr:hypothetical protein [Rhodospirillales bacterium]
MRAAILLIGAMLVAGGLYAAAIGATPLALELGGFGVLVLIGTALERRFYRVAGDPPPGPDWHKTDERFRDPTTGRV